MQVFTRKEKGEIRKEKSERIKGEIQYIHPLSPPETGWSTTQWGGGG
jgi:hypothetical protein